MRACVRGGADFLSVLQLDKAAYLSSLLHTSQQPLHAFVRRIRAQLSSQTEETRICAQVNATRRKEGGVFPCASINGRTGDSSSSALGPLWLRVAVEILLIKRRKNMTHDCNKRGCWAAAFISDHRYVRGDVLDGGARPPPRPAYCGYRWPWILIRFRVVILATGG